MHASPQDELVRARALRAAGQPRQALAAYLDATRCQPEFAEAFLELGVFLREQGHFDLAYNALTKATRLAPNSAGAWAQLAKVLKQIGRWEESLAAFRRARSLEPDESELQAAIIDNLHYQPTSSPAEIRAEQEAWNHRFAAPFRSEWRVHSNDRNPERKLRIGYVSASFRTHADASFLLAPLEEHDREAVEVHCYSNVRQPDEITARMQHASVRWHDIVNLSDDEVAGKIRADAIDIALDLNMHWAGGRLRVFARRPAPVQVSWLAFADDAGLDFFDYRLSDSFLDPLSDAEVDPHHVMRLPQTWGCFRPINDYPEVSSLPALRSGRVTFGALNNFFKVNVPVLQCWARVLIAVPGSTLLLECPDGEARHRTRDVLAGYGVAPDRITFAGRQSLDAYRRLYHDVDVALDPFPYNGCATTCDALWMGVPVVTLVGATPVARAGLSLLTNAGLQELVTYNENEYMRVAVELARDLPRLARLRTGMRMQLTDAPLMDGRRFAQALEGSFRAMWRRRCLQRD